MSDKNLTLEDEAGTEETMPALADASPQQQSAKSKLLILGGVGFMVLLCLGLLVGSGAFLITRSFTAGTEAEEASAAGITLPTEKTAGQFGESDQSGAEMSGPAANEDDNKVQAVEGDAISAADAPKIGTLTFALETDASAPVNADFEFDAGVTRLHALFDYANLTPDQIWTQVWYHDGVEVLSTSQPWLEDETGTFDYIIEAGGDPLPAGQWALEFYIDGELLTAGSFFIKGPAGSAAAADLPDPADIPKVYQLVYTKWNGEKDDMYVADTTGQNERFILGRAASPSWSLDGRYIFFYGEEGVDQQVINGTTYPLPGVTNGIIRLNASPLPGTISQAQMYQGHGWNDGTARGANVAPDGTMIAYDGDRGGGRRIYFLGTEANQQFRYEIIGEQADWSPDSQQIVYRSGRNNQTGIWISNRDDTGHTLITTGGTDSFPTWSPDGQTIAFSRDAGGNVDIYTVNVDGSDLKRLTDAPGHDTLPVFLPTGELIFRSARTGNWGIWKMDADGSNQTEIIPNAPVGPDWAFSKMSILR